MSVRYFLLIVIIYLVCILKIKGKDYNGYAVYRISITSDKEIVKLQELAGNLKGVDVWNLGPTSDIMVAPSNRKEFLKKLDNAHLNYTKLINDIKKVPKLKQAVKVSSSASCSRFKRDCSMTFDHYLRFKEIEDYLNNLAMQFNFTKLIMIGQSYEGRPMRVLAITTGKTDRPKPAIFIDGGIHAREWIAPAQVLYIINQLVEHFQDNQQLIENIDWYFLPVVNPDGYEYSFDYDRYWRKTRSQYINNTSDEFCIGTDANRNWDFHFQEDGYSAKICTDQYGGPQPFSETETRNIRNFVEQPEIKNNLKLYLTYHNYGSAILYPYGHSRDVIPPNKDQLHYLAKGMRKKLKMHYAVGITPDILFYKATGQSQDWFRDVLGVPLTYTIELPGGGEGGFDLPEEEILPVVSDMFEGVKYLAEVVMNNYY